MTTWEQDVSERVLKLEQWVRWLAEQLQQKERVEEQPISTNELEAVGRDPAPWEREVSWDR